MSQFFSTRYLRLARAARKGVIMRDEPCGGCSYNLRGLEYGGICPECGAPIQVPDAVRDSMTDAPRQELRRLRAGLVLAMIALPPMLLAFPIGAGLASMGDWLGPLLMLVPAILWIVAAWIITMPMSAPGARRRGFTARSSLRAAARWLQFCLPLSHGMLALAMGAPSGSRTTLVLSMVVAGLAAIGGLVGILLIAVLLGRLAEWGRNETAVKLFEWAIFGLTICSALLIGAVFNILLKAFGCAWAVFWIAALGCFFMGLVEMMRTTHWSIRHAHEREERARAAREKTAQTHATHPGECDEATERRSDEGS